MSLQITKHARISWLTRVKGLTHASATAYTDFAKVESDVAKTWEHAEYLATDKIGDNPLARYFISHDIVFVVSEKEDKLVTCYRVKYDLPNNLDELVRKELQKAVVDLRETVEREELKTQDQVAEIELDIDSLNEQIKLMEASIKEAKRSVQAKKEYIKTLGTNSLSARLDLQRAVRKLINAKELWITHKGD